jgi:two-component system response regulator AtoC
MAHLRQQFDSVRDSDLPVLITGESGTGKEVIARLLHAGSLRKHKSFAKVTCPAIPEQLFESELFGYQKGAFTGAVSNKPGRLEFADGGTLFLDEIGELEPAVQAKLLQVLQEGSFCRIGANEEKRVNVRLICATNRDLEQEIADGTFRRDLFYRINVVNLRLHSLRERIADLPDLITYFLERYNEQFNRRTRNLSPALLARLREYHWPGNIRELENLVKRYVVFGSEDAFAQIERHQPGSSFFPSFSFESAGDEEVSLKNISKQAMRVVEREVILKFLQKHQWNRKHTAKALRISYRALLYKMKDANLPEWGQSPCVNSATAERSSQEQALTA